MLSFCRSTLHFLACFLIPPAVRIVVVAVVFGAGEGAFGIGAVVVGVGAIGTEEVVVGAGEGALGIEVVAVGAGAVGIEEVAVGIDVTSVGMGATGLSSSSADGKMIGSSVIFFMARFNSSNASVFLH
jgi:hypothetical protein